MPALIAESAPRPFLVHSVYRSAINLSSGGDLVTLARPVDGALPSGILLDLGSDHRAIGVRPGMVVEVMDGEILLRDVGLRVVLPPDRSWSPRLASDRYQTDEVRRRWARRSPEVRSVAAVMARGRRDLGLWALLGDREFAITSARARTRASAATRPLPFGQSDLLARAGEALRLLKEAIATGDRPRATTAAACLIGLGPGLTPSGDDALAGFLAGLHALDHPMATFAIGALDSVESRTSAVAATLLRQAAQGAFAECIHTVLAGLLDPDPSKAAPAMARAAERGASSGIDCLVGILDGLDAAAAGRGTLQ
ncbi:MAG: DUF2877 domain-containing protein [Chloroflexota bacterium]|nr:DUF2877 domain-containing protein [Chloroflexota bacterium]